MGGEFTPPDTYSDLLPTPPPAPGIFDAPTNILGINEAWAGVLIGELDGLTDPIRWQGDDNAQYAAAQAIDALLLALATMPNQNYLTDNTGAILTDNTGAPLWA